jgi:anthranilate synthase
MAKFSRATLIAALLSLHYSNSFVPNVNLPSFTQKLSLSMSSTAVSPSKIGGRGAISTSQEAADKNLSLGAPGNRPEGGQFMTKGGIEVSAQVDTLQYVNRMDDAPEGSSAKAIEDLIDKLDSRKGVLLSSSYEFPGR